MTTDVFAQIKARIERATTRYGEFASTHEALGVAVEEWDEFREAIRSNDFAAIYHECMDVSAVLIRLAIALESSEKIRNRSSK